MATTTPTPLHESTATEAPGTSGSQFYIVLAPANFLDGKYTVFGIVTSGMDVVDKVRVGDKMKSVKIVDAGAQ